jgi:preprotein translocase subunit SecY
MSGVIPPIFASSLIMFPATAAAWFNNSSEIRWLQTLTAALGPGEPLHMLIYASMIVIFAFFYTALVFNSQETADNLKRSGALIPGIRPGKATADYIDGVMTRLTGIGAMYLVAVCLVPDLLRNAWHVPFYFGGTSLLIIVIVTMDFMSQVQNYMMSQQYESLLKKASFKSS